MILAILFRLMLIWAAGGVDSLEANRAAGTGAWAHANVYGDSLLGPVVAPGLVASGDSLRVWLSQSVARRTSCTYRVRSWYAGQPGPWSPVALISTGQDSAACGMTLDGRCVSGWAMPDTLGIARPAPPLLWRWDQTMRCWSQRSAQTFWWSAILAACGVVK